MSITLDISQRNSVLQKMAVLVDQHRDAIITANLKDLELYTGDDLAMRDRLKVDQSKIETMIAALQQLSNQEDPIGVERFRFTHNNGMKVYNKTAPFGTVLIIYESRPDVTIEAAGIAFKSGNKILLKGGKESLHSNLEIVKLWHQAFEENNISSHWVEYLNYNRTETQAFLEKPTQNVDLIVPRGGEKLIAFVKQHASCPVIVSGRGNNFVYVHNEADRALALDNIINGKTDKISACNAVDKVLIDKNLPNKEDFVRNLITTLKNFNVEILGDASLSKYVDVNPISDDNIWQEEFLDYKIVIGETENAPEAISKINRYSGGHSAAIITRNQKEAEVFMSSVDCAAVYHNASTRFTDGFQLGLGGELAISTDKLHQRGPIGLQHLVTNKWYIHGDGQIR
ncbi:glutamate-5-semialdehyde dehydrogenase [Aquimarina sp. BL5]|uniref:glutamate-5-semialdehyde dehydrogenase n=1 Tax=Aquimarina sp. BL5 TaxID=1714860 RepID=UPI000E4D986B|nr:glutamate-5-semialdehyde dehydrogenase [Aquimarina sp. BL5]AXT50456.1 glutamate-5-semialdehyde dehydrogenase [Aquimarina sp. BL5]RKM99850.1 glutamate-5-semialdehyde dehydrogenase [Aquimarina sp. BL5]